MDKPKGGRSKRAPYQSTHVRIPDTLKSRVEELKELYFSGSLEDYHKLSSLDSVSLFPSLSDALEIAGNVLANKGRKSTKKILSEFISALYKTDVNLD